MSSRAVWSSVIVHQLEIRLAHGCLRVPEAVKLHAPIVIRLNVERCKCAIGLPSIGRTPRFRITAAMGHSRKCHLRKMSGERWQLQQAWVMHGSTIRFPPVKLAPLKKFRTLVERPRLVM